MDQFGLVGTIPTGLPLPPVGARFVLLSDLPSRAVRPATDRPPSMVTWRLVAANNRSIGRATSVFLGVGECVDDIARLTEQVGQSSASVQAHTDGHSTAGSHWSWTVLLAGDPVAVSIHRYQRRVECERALRYFLDAVRLAPPVSQSVRRLGSRLGRPA
ncbi:MAG: hypothetical protein M3Y42_13700 [Actinomycetota bacterium]|nr:hypothetical protein [Actinomycetota bacterium]MDQ2958008.1 hypothetical protein [Actinomycetota bacterium]